MPLDFLTHDSYWVVGHMHSFYGHHNFCICGLYLLPVPADNWKDMHNERLAMVQFFWLMFIGVFLVFVTQHLLGLAWHASSCSRLCACWTAIMMNQISTVGAYILLVGMGIFLFNLIKSADGANRQIWKIHLVLERSIMTIDGVSHTTKDRERKRYEFAWLTQWR